MKKKIIGIIAIIVVLIGAGIFIVNRGKAVDVNMALVEKGNIAAYVEELGVVKTQNQASVYASTAGRVIEVLVEVGDSIEAGGILARIDDQQLTRQIRELEAQKSVITAQYNEAIKTIDQQQIDKLELQLSIQERRVQEAERRADSNKRLYEAGAISREEYESTITQLETETANLEGIKLDLEILKKPVSDNIVAGFQAQLHQVDLQIEDLNSKKKDFVVTAPIGGTVMTKMVEVGSYLQPGTPLMEIGNKGILYIESDILIGDMADIAEGAMVEISNRDLAIDGVMGTVRKIHPQAFSKISDLGIEQKRVTIEIDIKGEAAALRPGYDLDIKVIIDRREDALIIPENAVFQQDGKEFVFVEENGTAALRQIETGIESGRRVEVISGLQEGDAVVLTPDDKLEDGIGIKRQD
ncbi:efflux RND transporter periplasmic adaptor subunit [Natronincola peptidivorans]|uniref:efflux RND transporter periplasmic adaptor subunit n=1 Tax=Natronincola peptidivorans TaxID=426128 RepID=UPI000B8637A6|nr:efflux RND transporter periplasmic adaptor subunit [Natronincola peptidivorans]